MMGNWGKIGVLALLLMAPQALGQTVTRFAVAEGVKSELRSLLAPLDSGLEVKSVFCPGDLKLTDGAVGWEVDFDPAAAAPGRHQLPVTVLVNGVATSGVEVTVNLVLKVSSLMLRRDLQRGEVVTPENLEWRELELTTPLSGLTTSEEELLGLAANRRVVAGKPLRGEWFASPLAVRRGGELRVVMAQGGLKIETTGLAMTNGRVGETIQVRNPQSNRRFLAEIMAPGVARVVAQ